MGDRSCKIEITVKEDKSMSILTKTDGLSKIEIIGALHFHINNIIKHEDCNDTHKKDGEE